MRVERLVRQNEALVRLARSEKLAGGQWQEVLREVTEAAAWALETERTSVWLYDGQPSRLRCANLFESGPQRHSSGAELAAEDYPVYFAALREEHTIAAHDARIRLARARRPRATGAIARHWPGDGARCLCRRAA